MLLHRAASAWRGEYHCQTMYVLLHDNSLSLSLALFLFGIHGSTNNRAQVLNIATGLFRVVSVYSRGRGRAEPLRPPLTPFKEGAASSDCGSAWGMSLHGNSVTAQHHCTTTLQKRRCTASLQSITAHHLCTASLHSTATQQHCTASLHSVTAQHHCTVSLHGITVTDVDSVVPDESRASCGL